MSGTEPNLSLITKIRVVTLVTKLVIVPMVILVRVEIIVIVVTSNHSNNGKNSSNDENHNHINDKKMAVDTFRRIPARPGNTDSMPTEGTQMMNSLQLQTSNPRTM